MNEFFDKPTDLAPFTKAKAEDVNVRFAGVANGFDKLPRPHLTEKGFRDPVHVGDATQRTHAPSVTQIIRGTLTSVADTGAANAYVATLPVAPAALVAGMQISFRAANTNTGASTLNLNGLGARSVVRQTGNALASGDIMAGQVVTVTYDGTRWVATSYLPGQATTIEAQVTTATAAAATAEGARDTAQDHAASAYNAQLVAEAESLEAKRWATEDEDVPVIAGPGTLYSAKHWASQAQDAAGNSLVSAGNAIDAQGAAESARDAAQGHSISASGSAGAASTARDAAQGFADKSYDWANESEDVEVEPGLYSAKHWALKRAPITANITYTVGSGGDYATINEALTDLSNKRKQHVLYGNLKVELLLVSGFVLQEQVVIRDVDLGWIQINAQDDSVPVDLAGVSRTSVGSVYWPFIGAENAVLPKLDTCTFVASQTFTGFDQGIALVNSKMVIRYGGCKGARYENLVSSHGSVLIGNGNVWANDSVSKSGILATYGGKVVLADPYNNRAYADNNAMHGCLAEWGGEIVTRNFQALNPGGYVFCVSNGGIIKIASTETGTLSQTANTLTADGIIFR